MSERASSITDGTAAPRGPNRTAVGILFVHGIGVQRCGETLVTCAGALVRWLTGWYDGQPDAKDCERRLEVALLDASLQSDGAPASARLVFRRGGSIQTEGWLLAESWWADAFPAPSLREVAYWAMTIVPTAVVLHMRPPLREAMHCVRRVAAGYPEHVSAAFLTIARCTLACPFIVVLALCVQLVTLMVLLLAVVPAPALRQLVGAAQKALSSILGDSFVFVSDPVREAAIVSRFQRDLGWLAERCRKVFVVAHSQGAAVVYRGLERLAWEGRVPTSVASFVSFGSGLRKLFDLEEALKNPVPASRAGWITILLCGLVTAALAGSWLAVINAWVASGVVLLALALLFAWLGEIGSMAARNPVSLPVDWNDYYSSHDPVPNGPLIGESDSLAWSTVTPGSGAVPVTTDSEALAALEKAYKDLVARVGRLNSHLVHNLGSFLLDHTAYWSNPDEFVSAVVREVGTQSRMELPDGTRDEEWLALAAARRAWRVRLLVWLRRIAVLGALAFLILDHALLERLGTRLVPRLSSLSLTAWAPVVLARPFIVGALGGIAAMFALFALVFGAWRQWERDDLEAFFTRRTYPRWGQGYLLFALLGGLLVATSAWLLLASTRPMMQGIWGLPPLAIGAFALGVWLNGRAPGSRHATSGGRRK